MEIIVVNSLDEITAVGRYAHASKPSKYIQIDLDDNMYNVFGFVSGQLPTSIAKNNNYIKEWKTFKGVISYLKQCSISGAWGMSHWKN